MVDVAALFFRSFNVPTGMRMLGAMFNYHHPLSAATFAIMVLGLIVAFFGKSSDGTGGESTIDNSVPKSEVF